MNALFFLDIPSTPPPEETAVSVLIWIIVAVLILAALVAIIKIVKKRGRP